VRADIRDYAIPDLYLAASRGSKTKLLTGFKAAPFVEPATGLAYFRARWYDPSTGTFLTPDPMGYRDSSSLYAYAAGDPVNLSDPTGEAIPLLAVLGYLGWTAVNTAFDVGIDYGVSELTGEEFNFVASAGMGFGINLLTGGAGKARHLRHLEHLGDARRLASSGDELYLISQRRVARYQARLERLMQNPNTVWRSRTLGSRLADGTRAKGAFKGSRKERLAELSGRIDMMRQGQLRLGAGKYTSIHGIDAVYYDYRTALASGFTSKLDYREALARGRVNGQLSVLESKYRNEFSGNPESILGPGIKDPNPVVGGPTHFRQMSDDWIDQVVLRLRGSGAPGRMEMGTILYRHQHSLAKYINVLTPQGRLPLHTMP